MPMFTSVTCGAHPGEEGHSLTVNYRPVGLCQDFHKVQTNLVTVMGGIVSREVFDKHY